MVQAHDTRVAYAYHIILVQSKLAALSYVLGLVICGESDDLQIEVGVLGRVVLVSARPEGSIVYNSFVGMHANYMG